MDAGTVVGIALGSSIGTLLLAVFFTRLLKLPVAYPAGAPTITLMEKFSILNWFRVLYYFLPYALFLFGIIYDGLIRKIMFFPAGFIGLGAVLLNHSISLMAGSGAIGGATDKDICGIPGMSAWGSDLTPQNIVFASSVLSYIASYITTTQSDIQYTGIAWAGVFAVWLIQTIMFNLNGCDTSKPNGWFFAGSGTVYSKIIPPLIGLASGLLWGGLSGYLIATFGGNVGSGVDITQQQSVIGGKGPAMAPTSGVAGAGKCSPTEDGDQFVCEAYKNGELVTSTIVE
jgi:hypothetical protein